MKIAYDGHVFRWQKTGGVSRYFREIVSRIPEEWIPVLIGVEETHEGFPIHPRLRISRLSSVRPRRFTQPLKREYWTRQLLRSATLVHPTYYNLTGGMRFRDIERPVVITIHDLIAARFPHLEPDSDRTLNDQREAVTRADHVVCVSRSTERDLLEFFPNAAGKTSVIYHGSSFPIFRGEDPSAIVENPTFLFVGRRSTYKNFVFLLRVFARACSIHRTIKLRVAGPPLTDEERWLIHLLGIADRVETSVFPSEDGLRELYRSSVALLYPSFYEGFGIPPLEAMACGTLAITSNASSLPEVVGDGGITLDPADEDSWTEAILEAANGKLHDPGLKERGFQRAELLSWEHSAQSHIELYRQFE
jgi:glycosyltransferase involved in cell wall biosynthesis